MIACVRRAGGRAHNNSMATELTLVSTLMSWERCYVPEWLSYHFALGVARVYFLAAWDEKEQRRQKLISSLPEPWVGPMRNVAFSEPVQPEIDEPTLESAIRRCNSDSSCHAVTKSPDSGYIGKSGMEPREAAGHVSWWNPQHTAWDLNNNLLRQAAWKNSHSIRAFKVDDPRVHVICNVRGEPGSCLDDEAKSYQFRPNAALLLTKFLAPRHAGGWLMVLDIDEFLTIPEWPGVTTLATTLKGALGILEKRGASLVRVPELTFGANNLTHNPTCEVLRMFPTASEFTCPYNYWWKTIFRARPGWRPLPNANAHLLVEEPPVKEYSSPYFMADFDVTQIKRFSVLHPCKNVICKKWGPMIGSKRKPPLLQIRHYQTKSRHEYFSKIRRYQDQYVLNITAYTEYEAKKHFTSLDEPASPPNYRHCKRENIYCRSLAVWPQACPKDKAFTTSEESRQRVRMAESKSHGKSKQATAKPGR